MPIIYSIVARGTTTLAKYASCTGNFQEIAEHILAKIGTADERMTYTQPGYQFHYIVESKITYLCMTDDQFDRSKSFTFLTEIKKRFTKTYRNRVDTALPFAMQSEFSRVLASEMRHYSDKPDGDTDKIRKAEEQIDDVKQIMVSNIDAIAQRGEKLELLVEKADDLSATSLTFKKSSTTLARAMWMKNLKMIIAIVVIILIIVMIIVFASCGSDWSSCGSKS